MSNNTIASRPYDVTVALPHFLCFITRQDMYAKHVSVHPVSDTNILRA